jgi:hypothetical protein
MADPPLLDLDAIDRLYFPATHYCPAHCTTCVGRALMRELKAERARAELAKALVTLLRNELLNERKG